MKLTKENKIGHHIGVLKIFVCSNGSRLVGVVGNPLDVDFVF